MEIILLLSIFIVIHGYGGYTIPLLYGFQRNKNKSKLNDAWNSLNEITVVIAAYNEEIIIKEKIKLLFGCFSNKKDLENLFFKSNELL